MKKIAITLCSLFLTINCFAQVISPGFRNTTSFDDDSDSCYWTARVGTFVYYANASGVVDYTKLSDGFRINSTCDTTNEIRGHAYIMATSLRVNKQPPITATDSCMYLLPTIDSGGLRFRIIDASYDGIDGINGIDDYTMSADGTGLKRIPDGYTSSIRLGKMVGRNTWSWNKKLNPDYGSAGQMKKSSQALFYTMHVRPENAIVRMNYALVIRKPNLAPTQMSSFNAGECVMRIVEQNSDGSWPYDQAIDSSKCTRIVMYNSDVNNNPDNDLWVEGLVDGPNCTYMYTPWNVVSADLTKWMDKTVRIEIYTSDANNSFPLYGYFAGDFDSCALSHLGCTPDSSDASDTIYAPQGLRGYKWYASDNGPLDLSDPTALENSPFRQLTPANYGGETGTPEFTYKYAPHYDDFKMADGTPSDTQTFCCMIYHGFNNEHLDSTRIYINLVNNKPAATIEYKSPCGGPIKLHNATPNRPNMDSHDTITTWYIYDDTLSIIPVDTLYGVDTVYHWADTGGWYKVTLSVVSEDGTCVGTTTEIIRARYGAPAHINTATTTLCAGDKAHLYCQEDTMIVSRTWVIGDRIYESNIANSYDSLITELELGPNEVMLVVSAANGCADTSIININVYGTPILSFIDNDEAAICPGDSAYLNSVGTFAADNVWESTPPDPNLATQQGQATIKVMPDTTTIYTLKAPENSSCGQQDKSITLEVIPPPIPKMKLSNYFVNTDHPVILAEDISTYGATTEWELSDGTKGYDRFIRHTFTDLSVQEVKIYMHTCNRLGCGCSDTMVALPVETAIHWIPNVFTPDRDNNNEFGVQFSQKVYEYEFYIYNRNGQIVFESTDQDEKWDGTHDGVPCPTGAYAYFLRYRFDYNSTRHTTKGIVTIIR